MAEKLQLVEVEVEKISSLPEPHQHVIQHLEAIRECFSHEIAGGS